jgi:hypothetical protein
MDNPNYSTLTLNVAASSTFQTSFSSSPPLNMFVQSNYAQFEFTAPWPPGNNTKSGLFAYNTTVSFVPTSLSNHNISTVFGTGVSAFLYHDRAAFMADIGTPFIRKENPLNYISYVSSSASDSDLTIQVSTFSGHRYYAIFRSQGLSFPNFQFNPVVYTDSNYVSIKTDYMDFSPYADPSSRSNLTNFPFVSNYNPDFIHLPTQSTLAGIDPSNSKFTMNVNVQGKPIGYDISGATRNGNIYPSADPSIFEVRYPDTDIQGRVVTY